MDVRPPCAGDFGVLTYVDETDARNESVTK
jgi:hypothetical protein